MSFSVYRSSAGSGKTRLLAKSYIRLALAGGAPGSFRHILAVTFTNKATQEMKERIVKVLTDFAAGRPNDLADELKAELQLTDRQLRQQSQELLSLILHRYSQFAISTIDAFFQQVIRAFTREAGLLGNFRLEVDNDAVLDEVVAALMDDLGPGHPQLTGWVVRFAGERLAAGASWNVSRDLHAFAKQIFSEDFKLVEASVLRNTYDTHERTIRMLEDERRRFIGHMREKGSEAMQILGAAGLTADDFHYKDKGTAYKFFRDWSQGKPVLKFSSELMQKTLASAGNWPAKRSPNRAQLEQLAETKLLPLLQEMIRFDLDQGRTYRSAAAVLENYYSFGLLADIGRKLQEYKAENNLMLLSDAPQFLQGIIRDSDTPFLYEKVGAWFNHYLIDEFQDTSRLQWLNFVPLLKEAADRGFGNLIVGDVKQSIYRWRGGDLQLLQHDVVRRFANYKVLKGNLAENFRSAGNIIDFNNQFFPAAARLASEGVKDPTPANVYGDVVQAKKKWLDEGYVRIEFFKTDSDSDSDSMPWQERVLQQLPNWLEQLQERGVALKDIAILVRENSEGQRIANFLLQYQQSPAARPGFRYDVVSNESLRLDTAGSVQVLIAAFQVLKNPNDRLACAQLAYELAGETAADLFTRAGTNLVAEFIPEEFIVKTRHLTRLSLFELTEELIRIFGLGRKAAELAYLQGFQDVVLEFSSREKADLPAFLHWWEINKEKKSIRVSGAIDAVSVLTMHRAKGLQFRFVLIPFCEWKMNHKKNPHLWVQSDVPPFGELGFLAVKYKEDLSDTHFREAYTGERAKACLDNLNLLYVAFTRAEWGLLIFAPENGKGPSGVAGLLLEVLRGEADLAKRLNGQVFEWGELKKLPDTTPAPTTDTIALQQYISCNWREKLLIKRQGQEFFEAAGYEKRSKINRGNLLHQVLARIHHLAGWENTVQAFFQENPVEEELRTWITGRILDMMEHPIMSHWFAAKWQVMTEVSVLLPGGRQKRMDRVMTGKTGTVVVDYKTGEKTSRDAEQVEQYAGVLAAMGYPNVSAYLVYLQHHAVEEVVTAPGRRLFFE